LHGLTQKVEYVTKWLPIFGISPQRSPSTQREDLEKNNKNSATSACSAVKGALLFERWLGGVGGTSFQLVAHDDACACIPAQDAVLISRGPDFDGLLVQAHRFAQPVIGNIRSSGSAMIDQAFCAALANDAGIISAFVLVLQSRQQRAGLIDSGA